MLSTKVLHMNPFPTIFTFLFQMPLFLHLFSASLSIPTFFSHVLLLNAYAFFLTQMPYIMLTFSDTPSSGLVSRAGTWFWHSLNRHNNTSSPFPHPPSYHTKLVSSKNGVNFLISKIAPAATGNLSSAPMAATQLHSTWEHWPGRTGKLPLPAFNLHLAMRSSPPTLIPSVPMRTMSPSAPATHPYPQPHPQRLHPHHPHPHLQPPHTDHIYPDPIGIGQDVFSAMTHIMFSFIAPYTTPPGNASLADIPMILMSLAPKLVGGNSGSSFVPPTASCALCPRDQTLLEW